jgi:hypothetical protein
MRLPRNSGESFRTCRARSGCERNGETSTVASSLDSPRGMISQMAYESRLFRRHSENSDGPFYVVNGECISCGAPEIHAPTLISHDAQGHCFFARQPVSPEETNDAIKSTWASCCGALRYSGTHRETLIRLAELGLGAQCDFRLNDEPQPLAISCVSFEFGERETADARVANSRQISEYLESFLQKPGHGNGKTHSLSISGLSRSFVYQWADDCVPPGGYQATFVLEPAPQDQRWTVRISRGDGHELVAFAIQIHGALQQDPRFRAIRWFTKEEWNAGKAGRSLPY